MDDLTITGLSRIRSPKPNKAGNSILAYFGCEVRGSCLRGCALVRTANNGLTAWTPHLLAESGGRSILISDSGLQRQMTIHACKVYRAFGGTDA